MIIRRAWVLIAGVLAGQFICVAGGVLWYAAWHESLWTRALNDHFMAQNDLLVAQAAARLARELDLPAAGPLDPDTRQRLQQFVESISLPKRWYLCAFDETGVLVADPQMALSPDIAHRRPGHWILHTPHGSVPLADALRNAPERAVSGLLRMADGVHLVAAHPVGDSSITLMAHQQAAALEPLTQSILAPVRKVGLAIAVLLVLMTGLVTQLLVSRYESRLAVLNGALEAQVRKRSAQLVQTRDAVIFGLAKLADSRDRQTGQHLERMQELVCLLAGALRPRFAEIDDDWIQRLRLAAVLHDIGKVGIPDAILLKRGPLTRDERRVMERHTMIGAECLAVIGARLGANDFLAMARDIALCHHERWDGRGYPRGLAGRNIPLAARIVALADLYDAASSERVYKPSQPHEVVRGIILENRGRQLDPDVVDAFLRVEAQFCALLAAPEAPPESAETTALALDPLGARS